MWVTPEQIEKAKQMDLLTYLQSYEPNNLKKISHDTWCTKEHDSLKISNGKWHWFSRHIGGKTALDYLIKVKGISFVQAVEIITGYSAVLPPIYTPAQKPNQPKALELPESNSDICAVRRYLKSRGIADAIIDYCRNNKLLYEDAKYHNCIFLGYDGDMPKYGAVRSTNSDFKRDLTGSDKRFSFFISAESKTQTVHLFESAIDLLSYATLELRHGQSRHDDLLSLAGVYKTENKQDIPLALKTYLDRHKETKVIYLHLDNDEVGRTATRQITDALSAEYILKHPNIKLSADGGAEPYEHARPNYSIGSISFDSSVLKMEPFELTDEVGDFAILTEEEIEEILKNEKLEEENYEEISSQKAHR